MWYHAFLPLVVRDQRRGATSLRVHVLVQVKDVVAEQLLGALVQVAHGDAGSENGEVGVRGGRAGGCAQQTAVHSVREVAGTSHSRRLRTRLSSKLIELGRGHAGVHATHDLLGDEHLWASHKRVRRGD